LFQEVEQLDLQEEQDSTLNMQELEDLAESDMVPALLMLILSHQESKHKLESLLQLDLLELLADQEH
jgi:hypothetical protein